MQLENGLARVGLQRRSLAPKVLCTYYDTFLCPHCFCNSCTLACRTLALPEGFWSFPQKSPIIHSVEAGLSVAFLLNSPYSSCVGFL